MLVKGASILLTSLFSFTSFANAAPTATSLTSALNPQDGNATIIAFDTAQWIWTGENAGPGGNAPISTRAFRKTIESPTGKCAVCATILITADNEYTLYVNGAPVGNGADWATSQVYTAGLNTDSNVFAVSATNTGGPAGVIATILIQYKDGTSDTFYTDATWKTFVGNVPTGFENPSFSDSSWSSAVTEGTDGVSPWGNVGIPPALDLTQSHWIWTSEATSPGANVPPGTRFFKKTISSPAGKCAVCAKVVMTVDNGYSLYFNGMSVGSGSDFHAAQYYSMTNLNPDSNLFIVSATNAGTTPNPAGVIATILIAYNDGTSELYRTDTTWTTVPQALPLALPLDLSALGGLSWQPAVDEGPYGVSPWGAVSVPSA